MSLPMTNLPGLGATQTGPPAPSAPAQAADESYLAPIRPEDDIATITARMRANPMFEEFEAAIQEYRRLTNTVPDPDEVE